MDDLTQGRVLQHLSLVTQRAPSGVGSLMLR
jgi:hypothetical protein